MYNIIVKPGSKNQILSTLREDILSYMNLLYSILAFLSQRLSRITLINMSKSIFNNKQVTMWYDIISYRSKEH